MSIVFGAVVPHSPLLLPQIRRSEPVDTTVTSSACEFVANQMAKVLPDTVIIVSPHPEIVTSAISLNLSPTYRANLADFGDLATKTTWSADIKLINNIRDGLRLAQDFSLDTNENLDYAATVSLLLLKVSPQTKIVPITTSELLSAQRTYEIGRAVANTAQTALERVAIICSADLSAQVNGQSNQKVTLFPVVFDDLVLEMIRLNKLATILDVDPLIAKNAAACGLKPLALFAGCFDGLPLQTNLNSYENLLGLGLLVASLI